MSKKSMPLSKVYGLLEPGPVVLVTTAGAGATNIMTLSWHTMLEFEPPLVACVLSDDHYSYDLLQAGKDCVINIPTAKLSKEVVDCGNTSGRTVDKFKAFGLTAVPASCVASPLIDECYANLECRVVDETMVAQYNLFILEVVKAWVDPQETQPQTLHHRGEGVFMIAGETIRLPSKMK